MKLSKRFIYYFILDLGISPFIKAYQGKSLMTACVTENLTKFTKEIMSHRYVVRNDYQKQLLMKSAKQKD